jgi:hypothetical protein
MKRGMDLLEQTEALAELLDDVADQGNVSAENYHAGIVFLREMKLFNAAKREAGEQKTTTKPLASTVTGIIVTSREGE